MHPIDVMQRNLADAPILLKDLLRQIPPSLLKVRRHPERWSIHEHTCHLADVQPLLYDRFLTFKNADHPVFQPFLPGTNVDDSHLLTMDLQAALHTFTLERARLLDQLETFTEADWRKQASHPEYNVYTPEILLRHVLMHDYLHMYRIEELWLTREGYL